MLLPYVLFDGKGTFEAIAASCFVDATVGSTADEADDLISTVHLFLAGVSRTAGGHGPFVVGICGGTLDLDQAPGPWFLHYRKLVKPWLVRIARVGCNGGTCIPPERRRQQGVNQADFPS